MAEQNYTIDLDSSTHTFEFIGGALCLDFVNTVDGRAGEGSHRDHLNRYGELLVWAIQAGMLDATQAERLKQQAENHPIEVAAVLDQAHLLRESLYRIFSALDAGQVPEEADLNELSHVLSEAMAHASLSYDEGAFVWDWSYKDGSIQRILWPVARSAAELLTSSQIDRVHKCASDNCGWVFLDTSKNHSRRWCSMETCGNVTKVRKHRKRKRRADGEDAAS